MAINLSGLLKAAGAGFAGYGADKDAMVRQALAEAAAVRQAKNDAISNQVKMAGIDPAIQGRIAGARADAGVNAAVNRTKLTAPIETQKAVDIATKTAPIAQETHAANAKVDQLTHAANTDYDVAHPTPQTHTATIGGDPGVPGSGTVISVDSHSGKQVGVLGDSKGGASTAKLTEPQEKSYLFYNLMKNAEPQIGAALASGKIRPAAISTYLGAGAASDIPVVGKAIGVVAKPAANANLNDDEQRLIRSMKDFAAGVLRKESGAAVTNSELMEVMDRYFPGMFGDKPGLTQDKNAARLQYMKTMEQEAGPAIQFYGRQKPAASGSSREQQLWDAAVAKHGEAKVLAEFGPRPPE